MQAFFKTLLDDLFYSTLTAFIGYLRRQQILIGEMGTQAKKLQDTRWESMYHTSKWFKTNRIPIMEYVEEKEPSCAPSNSWWIVLMAVESISSFAVKAAKTLQGHTTLVSQQRQALEKLVATLIGKFSVQIVSDSEREALRDDDNWILSADGRFALHVDDIRGFLDVSRYTLTFRVFIYFTDGI